jgi:outer membrane protein assembly factor BamB
MWIKFTTPLGFLRSCVAHGAYRVVNVLAWASLVLGASSETGVDSNWPQFRGTRASGIAEGRATPTTWDVVSGEHIAWRAAIPGMAHASPIVWGGRVYLATAVKPSKAELKVGLYGDTDSVTEREPHQWRLLAIDKATGTLIWDAVGYEGVPHQRRHTKSSQCNSTPATDGRYIAAIFGSEGLFCFDLSGKLLWRKDLGLMDAGPYTSPTEQWGFGSSPVIHQGRVIVQCDVLSEQYLVAFELKDGRQVWRSPRQEVTTWCTPTVAETSRGTQIVVNGWRHQGGYDYQTGKELWKLSGGGDAPVPTPVVGHGLVYLTSAHGSDRPMRAVRLDRAGIITPSEIEMTNAAIAWTHPRKGNYLQTPIVVGDLLYGCTDYGLVTCFDARTGRIHYSERLRGITQGFTASPVSSCGKLYFTGEQGEVFVLPAGDRFTVLATNRLAETCLSTPAISDGRIFFRTRGHLVAVDSRP